MVSAYLVRERLGQTKQWMHAASDRHYSIQLFTTTTDHIEDIEIFLRKVPVELDFEKIFVYETMINKQNMYSVVYNEYHDLESAQFALDSLPRTLRRTEPFLRNVSSIRDDVVKRKSDGIS